MASEECSFDIYAKPFLIETRDLNEDYFNAPNNRYIIRDKDKYFCCLNETDKKQKSDNRTLNKENRLNSEKNLFPSKIEKNYNYHKKYNERFQESNIREFSRGGKVDLTPLQ